MPNPGADLLREVGEALDGPRWQSEMARRRGAAIRTVQRIVACQAPVPPGFWPELREDIRARQQVLADLLKKLPR